jgi:hypothetical protein
MVKSSSSISSSRMMMIVCYYVVLTSLLLSMIEIHTTSGLPINHDDIIISQDSKEATPSPPIRRRQIDDLRLNNEGDKNNVDDTVVKSNSVSLTMWRIRRSVDDTSGDPLPTTTPPEEKSYRKRLSDIFRNAYHNRSGWGGGYGRRRR